MAKISELHITVTAVRNMIVDETTFKSGERVKDVDLNDLGGGYTKDELDAKFDEKADVIHKHIIDDVEGLQDELNNKSNVGHRHDITDINNLSAELDGKLEKFEAEQTYATKDELANVTVDLTGYATEKYVDEAVANVTVDLTGYATEQYVQDELQNYVNEDEVDDLVMADAAGMIAKYDSNGAVRSAKALQAKYSTTEYIAPNTADEMNGDSVVVRDKDGYIKTLNPDDYTGTLVEKKDLATTVE